MFSRQGVRIGAHAEGSEDLRRTGGWFLKLRIGVLALLALGLALLALAGGSGTALAATHEAGKVVDVASLNGEINTASEHFLTGAISTAESDGAQALVIEVNTPG